MNCTKLQLQMIGTFSELERSTIKSKIIQGIQKAKERGAYKGRKKTIDDNLIIQMKQSSQRVCDIARELSISRMSVYRALKAVKFI